MYVMRCRYSVALILLCAIVERIFCGRHVGVRDVQNLTVHDTSQQLFHERDFQANCTVPVCDGELAEIYCGGPLLFASHYFNFRQSCPGNRLKFMPSLVLKNFDSLARPLNRTTFKSFCEENFEAVEYLKPAKLADWNSMPKTFEAIFDPKMKKLAIGLHNIWPELSREFIEDVHRHKERYPVLSVPHPFIVPGGQFQVYFYWDSYWIIKGLLFSELFQTALGILRNFALIIKERGFIPNSGNIELSRRSQPPLFIHMLYDFYTAIRDTDADARRRLFLQEFLPFAEQELMWWQENRAVTIMKSSAKYQLFQYRAATNCPRPENLLDDYYTGLNSAEDPRFIWSSTASACESGLDFTVRWFSPGIANRTGMETNVVVPVDLNVFMARNFQIMSELYRNYNDEKSRHFEELSNKLNDAIDAVLYDKFRGIWFDYDLRRHRLRDGFYPSNIFPLLLSNHGSKCVNVLRYLNLFHAFDYKGGIPSSFVNNSREQWDFPNAWAPSVHLFVMSLLKCNSLEIKEKAQTVANGFITTVYNGLFNPLSGYPAQVWEKYDVRFNNGISGFGGEYPVQAGFGWTNGAVLDFINQFYVEKEIALTGEVDLRRVRNGLESSSTFYYAASIPQSTLFNGRVMEGLPWLLHTSVVFLAIVICITLAAIYFYAGVLRNHRKNLIHSVLVIPPDVTDNESEMKKLLP